MQKDAIQGTVLSARPVAWTEQSQVLRLFKGPGHQFQGEVRVQAVLLGLVHGLVLQSFPDGEHPALRSILPGPQGCLRQAAPAMYKKETCFGGKGQNF